MLAELILATIIGIFLGTITGLTPGIHINLISAFIIGASPTLLEFTAPITLVVAIIAMAVTHTFIDAIPSTYLGAPDADMALGALPGHKLLLEGKGHQAIRLTVIGSLSCLALTICIIPFTIPLLPYVYTRIQPYIGHALLLIVVFMIFKDKKKILWSAAVFSLSGALGIITNNLFMENSLLPMLSGLFGVSTLVVSLCSYSKVPKQNESQDIIVSPYDSFKAITGATVSGCITGLLPGLGSAQAAIIAMQFVGALGAYGFLIMIGGINTVNFVFSTATLYALGKARNGAIIAVSELINSITASDIIIILSIALLSGGIAALLTLHISIKFSKIINKVNYPRLCYLIIGFICFVVLLFSGLMGILVLAVATAIGIIPQVKNVNRSLAMGCLLLPTILFFLSV